MENFNLFLKAVQEEMQKCNLNDKVMVEYNQKLLNFNGSFDSPYTRCAYMYKHATCTLGLIKYCIGLFLKDCETINLLLHWKSCTDLTFCSMSCGPALEYLAFILAVTETVELQLQPFFKTVNIISKSAQWKNTFNSIIESIQLGYLKDFPVAMIYDNFKIIQNNSEIFSEKQKAAVENADVLFMMKFLNFSGPALPDKQKYLQEVVEGMKIDSLLFCIDTKPSIACMSEILSAVPGKYIYASLSNSFQLPEKFPESYKEIFGCLPVLSSRGGFFVWKKLPLDSLIQIIQPTVPEEYVLKYCQMKVEKDIVDKADSSRYSITVISGTPAINNQIVDTSGNSFKEASDFKISANSCIESAQSNYGIEADVGDLLSDICNNVDKNIDKTDHSNTPLTKGSIFSNIIAHKDLKNYRDPNDQSFATFLSNDDKDRQDCDEIIIDSPYPNSCSIGESHISTSTIYTEQNCSVENLESTDFNCIISESLPCCDVSKEPLVVDTELVQNGCGSDADHEKLVKGVENFKSSISDCSELFQTSSTDIKSKSPKKVRRKRKCHSQTASSITEAVRISENSSLGDEDFLSNIDLNNPDSHLPVKQCISLFPSCSKTDYIDTNREAGLVGVGDTQNVNDKVCINNQIKSIVTQTSKINNQDTCQSKTVSSSPIKKQSVQIGTDSNCKSEQKSASIQLLTDRITKLVCSVETLITQNEQPIDPSENMTSHNRTCPAQDINNVTNGNICDSESVLHNKDSKRPYISVHDSAAEVSFKTESCHNISEIGACAQKDNVRMYNHCCCAKQRRCGCSEMNGQMPTCMPQMCNNTCAMIPGCAMRGYQHCVGQNFYPCHQACSGHSSQNHAQMMVPNIVIPLQNISDDNLVKLISILRGGSQPS